MPYKKSFYKKVYKKYYKKPSYIKNYWSLKKPGVITVCNAFCILSTKVKCVYAYSVIKPSVITYTVYC